MTMVALATISSGAAYQHGVQTAAQVMIVRPMVREMPGYQRNANVAAPTQPYAMFPGTKYEHLMLPITATKQKFGARTISSYPSSGTRGE
jgi:hypothetical protein